MLKTGYWRSQKSRFSFENMLKNWILKQSKNDMFLLKIWSKNWILKQSKRKSFFLGKDVQQLDVKEAVQKESDYILILCSKTGTWSSPKKKGYIFCKIFPKTWSWGSPKQKERVFFWIIFPKTGSWLLRQSKAKGKVFLFLENMPKNWIQTGVWSSSGSYVNAEYHTTYIATFKGF